MLLPINGETLIARAWRLAGDVPCTDRIVAIPQCDAHSPLMEELTRIGATVFVDSGVENDVLGRFYRCAHLLRWHPDSIIVRWTPDDIHKDPHAVALLIQGERMPVELGGEAFTLQMLDTAERCTPHYAYLKRQHITLVLFDTLAPAMPSDSMVWEINTPADYAAAVQEPLE